MATLGDWLKAQVERYSPTELEFLKKRVADLGGPGVTAEPPHGPPSPPPPSPLDPSDIASVNVVPNPNPNPNPDLGSTRPSTIGLTGQQSPTDTTTISSGAAIAMTAIPVLTNLPYNYVGDRVSIGGTIYSWRGNGYGSDPVGGTKGASGQTALGVATANPVGKPGQTGVTGATPPVSPPGPGEPTAGPSQRDMYANWLNKESSTKGPDVEWQTPPFPSITYKTVLDNAGRPVLKVSDDFEESARLWTNIYERVQDHNAELRARKAQERQVGDRPTGPPPTGFMWQYSPATRKYEPVPDPTALPSRQFQYQQYIDALNLGRRDVQDEEARRLAASREERERSRLNFDINQATADLQERRRAGLAREGLELGAQSLTKELRTRELSESERAAKEREKLEDETLLQHAQQFLLSNPFAIYLAKALQGGNLPGPAPRALDISGKFADRFTGQDFPVLSPMALGAMTPTERSYYTGIAGVRGLAPEDLQYLLDQAVPQGQPRPRRRPARQRSNT